MKIEKKTKEIKKERVYSNQELTDFNIEIEPYKITATMPDGRETIYLTIGGQYAYLRSKGIIESWQEIDKTIKAVSLLPAWRIKMPKEMFEEHGNKMKQYWNWLGRMQFGQERRLEQLNMVAMEMEFPEI